MTEKEQEVLRRLGITPGPWSVPHFAQDDHRCSCGYVWGADESGLTICEVVKHDANDVCSEHYDIETSKKNAMIIAAAPEMLEAIIGHFLTMEIGTILSRQEEKMFDSILKATGKSWEEIRRLLDE